MLIGLSIPDAGHIELDGEDITYAPFYERARRGLSYLPQDSFVPRALSVEANLEMVLEVREPSRARRKEIAEALFEQFHLGEFRKLPVGALSGGQRRRSEIAISLACEPGFALLDEPFARVDPQAIEEIVTLIRQMASRGIGVLITDHNARELLQLVDRSYVIESGRVLAHGDAKTLMDDPSVRRVYLGEEFRI
jgi:lipopolysaccharide export system ATP-binding protein